mmetsp:Transcript_17736/g.21530  ORF Transcript_17736/g.21530 Transcript_17736/m.21530 type:complete len:313 (+) Transcript_17736:99-1037(+)|eukprot:CAMPEP_0184005622 /NCGR_PEP_ID=MMETSP0954-20121128/174_1 /TAXON_ID=627963 /ORGANISM="Aplanochytrium sp, Strain PBS07" /LENGTH=312 /DNA_ID=CAMNT_0026283949 /DNA_START=69 /DNA_END=1007 /DNA_ORIENTATION=+
MFDLEQEQNESRRVTVMPGEIITTEDGFLRGHGTYILKSASSLLTSQISGSELKEGDAVGKDEEESEYDGPEGQSLVSSVAGTVLRVNKLITVQPRKSRYSGDVGDIVVGRIIEVGNKRWKVDINARQSATLLLGSINLPGGALRRRTIEDQLQMRSLFTEGDLISAEVSSLYQSGSAAIHTRSMRYGKLENGQVVVVPSALIKRVKQHFVSLPCGVDCIFGHNGGIWITSRSNEFDEREDTEQTRNVSEMEEKKKKHSLRRITAEERLAISKVRNAIILLASKFDKISPESVMKLYNSSDTLTLGRKQQEG